MIAPMCRLRLFGPRPLLPAVTALLQEMGVVHVDSPPSELRWGFRPFEEDSARAGELVALETLLERLRRALVLAPLRPGEHFPADRSLETLDPQSPDFTSSLTGLLAEIEALHLRLKEAREERDLLEKYEKVIRSLAPLLGGVTSSPHIEMIGITFDRSGGEILPLLREALGELTGGDYQIFAADLDRQTQAAVLVFGRSSGRRVRELLRERDLAEIRLPGKMADLPLKEALHEIHRRLEALPRAIEESQRELEEFSRRWHDTIERARQRVQDRMDQLLATRRFLCSKYTFQVSGWVPRREAAALKERFAAELGEKVAIEIDEEVPPLETPVQIRNPSLVRPFEVFTRLLPLPLYGTIDPTPFFAFFFPLFFGLILGDVGYGLAVMTVALLVRRRSSPGTFWRDVSTVFLVCSLFAVLFGVLYGEFFSTLGEHLGLLHVIGRPVAGPDGEIRWHPLLYDRIKAMTTVLAIAVSIGAAHVILGLLLGIFTALRSRRYVKLLVKAGMLLAIVATILLLVSFRWPLPQWVAWGSASLLALSLVGITLLEGFVAPIEMMSSLGNILSYARLMAIGLASVILGLVANRLGAIPDNIVVGILIAAFLHAVNIVLGIFSPTIHSMRLHFVEFFGKFYEPGGRPYQPFRKSGGP